MKLTRAEAKRSSYGRHQNRVKGRDIRVELESLPDLLRLSRAEDMETRAAAVQYLCPCHVQRNEPEVWNRLFELTQDPDLKIRNIVFHILGDGSPRERAQDVVVALEGMYQDPDPKLRRRVRKLLAHFRRTNTVNVL